MTKYYTIKECFDACGDDDIPFNDEIGFNQERVRKATLSKTFKYAFSLNDMDSDKWQIKRASPVVYDVENLISKYYSTESQRSFVRLCDQNGQLREWQRPEQVELREAVKAVINNHFGWNINRRSMDKLVVLKSSFDNLKPPKGV